MIKEHFRFFKIYKLPVHGAANVSVAAMQIPFAGIKLNECFFFSPHSFYGVLWKVFFVSFSGSHRQFISFFPSWFELESHKTHCELFVCVSVTAWHVICNKHSFVRLLLSTEINMHFYIMPNNTLYLLCHKYSPFVDVLFFYYSFIFMHKSCRLKWHTVCESVE